MNALRTPLLFTLLAVGVILWSCRGARVDGPPDSGLCVSCRPVDGPDSGSPDSGLLDGGIPDGGVPDGGSVGSLCAGGGFFLCDGFEGADIDMGLWSTKLQSNATVSLDATRAFRGGKSLHVHVGNTAGTAGGLRTARGFPIPGNVIWGRAFIYMANSAPDMHTNMFEAVGPLLGGVTSHYRLGITAGHLSGNYIPNDYGTRSATLMPLDHWACLEWQFNGSDSSYHAYLDGAELTDLAVTSSHTPAWTAPVFQYFELGLRLYHSLASPSYDFWIDEFALDAHRITCSR